MMNKIYSIFVIVAIGGLLFANVPVPTSAASNLEYMLSIAENGQKFCKSEIEARESVPPEILELYRQSLLNIENLSSAIDANDVKSAREHFVSSMQKIKEISLMISQLESAETESKLSYKSNLVLDRFEINVQKLKAISAKFNANIDFQEIDNLMILAKDTYERGDSEKTKQILSEISKKGSAIYQVLKSITEENKIVRAKVLADRHIQQINILILQAKELGLQDSVSKLEQSKLNLISANNTSQIKQHVKIIIVLHKSIEKSKIELIDSIKNTDIQLSQQQKFSLQVSQLENKLNILNANAYGNNLAIYYLDKAASLLDLVKQDLSNPTKDISEKIKQIENIISKVEKMLQEAT
tara:strand:- start:1194 stop:2258 length:1065 start_codon:yes stop_codon:yes gene_type:complete